VGEAEQSIVETGLNGNIIFVAKPMFWVSRNPIKYILAIYFLFFIREIQNGRHLSAEKQENSQLFNDNTPH